MFKRELIAAKLRRWERYLEKFNLPKWEELPAFDLYMDQVIALLTKYLDFLPHEDTGGEKIVTPVAINNYVRMKIMPAPVKKKYSRMHLAYLIMIGALKQTLSISYITKIIPNGIEEQKVRELYNDYVNMHKNSATYFIGQVRQNCRAVLDGDENSKEPVVSMLATAATISTFSKLLCEKVINLEGVTELPQEKL